MPHCSIVGCGVRKSKNQPNISLHSLPKNELTRNKWLEIIGKENLKASVKRKYICSLHFQDTCFNRTLEVMRLHDDAIPSCMLLPKKKTTTSNISVKNEGDDTSDMDDVDVTKNKTTSSDISVKSEGDNTSDMDDVDVTGEETTSPNISIKIEQVRTLQDTDNMAKPTASTSDFSIDPKKKGSATVLNKVPEPKMVKILKERCERRHRTIKKLYEKLRRREKKLAQYAQIIKHLRDSFLNKTIIVTKIISE